MPQVSSPLGHPQSRAKLNHTTFRLSQNFKFTSGVGQYLPVFYDIAQPGEEYTMDFEMFSRNMTPLTSPAQTVIDEFIEVYFVPMGRLSSFAESALTKVNDVHSSLLREHFNDDGSADLNEDLIPIFDFSTQANTGASIRGNGQYGARFDSIVGSAYRLADMFGYNPNEFLLPFFNSQFHFDSENYFPSVNLLPFYAYQAIYHDINRLTNWEQMNAYCSNMDYIQSTPNSTIFIDSTTDPKSMYHLFQIRYRAYNRDFFKAVEANPLFVDNSTLDLNFADFNARNYISFNSSIFSNRDADESVPQSDSSKTQVLNYIDANRGVNSVNQIKSLFALDKLTRAIGMNSKHYDNQILARFGVKVPHDWRHEIQKIGEYHGTIGIGEVIATATTGVADGGTLGDLAGKAYGKGRGSKIRFNVPVHGVIMALYSSAPRINYIQGIDRLHTVSNFYDFPQPELDNLGMEPMFGYEGFGGTYGTYAPTAQMGWRARYMPFKSKPNRATRCFRDDYSHTGMNGLRRDWTIAKCPWDAIASIYGNSLLSLLVSPHDTDSLFAASYRTDVIGAILSEDETGEGSYNYANIIYAYDTFEHDLQINCFKKSWMSTFGVESL